MKVEGEVFTRHPFVLDSCPTDEPHRIEDCTIEVTMKHEWKSHKNPDTPDGPGEWITYCDACGVESDGDNEDGECVPVEDDSSVVAPILPPYEGRRMKRFYCTFCMSDKHNVQSCLKTDLGLYNRRAHPKAFARNTTSTSKGVARKRS